MSRSSTRRASTRGIGLAVLACIQLGTGCNESADRQARSGGALQVSIHPEPPGARAALEILLRRDGSVIVAYTGGLYSSPPAAELAELSFSQYVGTVTPNVDYGLIDVDRHPETDAVACVSQSGAVGVLRLNDVRAEVSVVHDGADDWPVGVAWISADELLCAHHRRIVRFRLRGGAMHAQWSVSTPFEPAGVSVHGEIGLAWSLSGDVTAIELATGSVSWTAEIPDINRCVGSEGNPQVLATTYFGKLYDVNVGTGDVVAVCGDIEGIRDAAPRALGGLIVGDAWGNVYAVAPGSDGRRRLLTLGTGVKAVASNGDWVGALAEDGSVARVRVR